MGVFLKKCGKCGNGFEKDSSRCRYCGSRRSLNFELIVISLLVTLIVLLVILTLKP